MKKYFTQNPMNEPLFDQDPEDYWVHRVDVEAKDEEIKRLQGMIVNHSMHGGKELAEKDKRIAELEAAQLWRVTSEVVPEESGEYETYDFLYGYHIHATTKYDAMGGKWFYLDEHGERTESYEPPQYWKPRTPLPTLPVEEVQSCNDCDAVDDLHKGLHNELMFCSDCLRVQSEAEEAGG